MTAERFGPRPARVFGEHLLVFVVLCFLGFAVVRVFTPPVSAERPALDQFLGVVLGLFRCFGLLVTTALLLAAAEVLKQYLDRRRLRRTERKLLDLQAVLRDARAAEPARVFRLLRDPLEGVRRRALAASYALLRSRPDVPLSPLERAEVERAFLNAPGFPRALREAEPGRDLRSLVTLGAKLGAGRADKRLAPPSAEPADIVAWVRSHRKPDEEEGEHPELQISVGYDTGSLPWLEERSRFVALYLYIATTDPSRFQALVSRPPRDPNAAFGLVIRGDVVEAKAPGESRGHRLDYVFPLPLRLSDANLSGLVRQIQVLNLGLLLACAEDAARVLLGDGGAAWLTSERRAAAKAYRDFERDLVRLLRRYDAWRDPGAIHRLDPGDHEERVAAFLNYRLEESLYPCYSWVVPLYDTDTRWERLLPPLRAVEAMMLHQGEAEGAIRGTAFIHDVRRLGDEAARRIEAAEGEGDVATDPFLDAGDEAATREYLERMSAAARAGALRLEDLPSPETFRRAARYYGVARDRAEAEP